MYAWLVSVIICCWSNNRAFSLNDVKFGLFDFELEGFVWPLLVSFYRWIWGLSMSHTIRQFICLTQLESVRRSVGETQGKDGVDVFHGKECDGWPLVKWLGTICLATCVICFLFHSSFRFRLLPCGCLVFSGRKSKSIGSTISLDAYSFIWWLPLYVSIVCKSMLTRVTHVLTFIRKFRLNIDTYKDSSCAVYLIHLFVPQHRTKAGNKFHMSQRVSRGMEIPSITTWRSYPRSNYPRVNFVLFASRTAPRKGFSTLWISGAQTFESCDVSWVANNFE